MRPLQDILGHYNMPTKNMGSMIYNTYLPISFKFETLSSPALGYISYSVTLQIRKRLRKKNLLVLTISFIYRVCHWLYKLFATQLFTLSREKLFSLQQYHIYFVQKLIFVKFQHHTYIASWRYVPSPFSSNSIM